MRMIIAVVSLVLPLAACQESDPVLGSGGWQDGDVPEAVPVSSEDVATPAQPTAPPARPTLAATPAAAPAVEPTPPPVQVPTPTAPEATTPAPAPPDSHAGHTPTAETPPAPPEG